MKVVAVTGLGGIVTATAAAGLPALAVIGLLVFLGTCAGCWVIANRARTINAVAIIAAARGHGPGSVDNGQIEQGDTRSYTPAAQPDDVALGAPI